MRRKGINKEADSSIYMNNRDPKLTVLLFNECINNQDIEGLTDLMTDNHRLICYGHKDATGKDSTKQAWLNFFNHYPHYSNNFVRVESSGNFVVMTGSSKCSKEESLNGNALWSAIVENDKVSEWQVYEDNAENRRRLKVH